MSDQEKGAISPPPSEHEEIEETHPDPDAGKSPEEKAEIESKLVRRLDWMLIPWLCLLYLLSFLDRTNIGNAKIAHISDDIHMTGPQYNEALTIFFISYALVEPLTNVLLKRMRPSVFIPIIMVLWGFCMFAMGFVTNWGGLMAARFFLGLTEAGLFPGINYYLSCWYRRDELGIRLAIFFSAAAVSGSFGGLLAAGIQQMDGIRGIKGWAWIFIIEGLLTVVFGIASFWMVHDFPDDAKFLSPDDRLRIYHRLKSDQQSSAEKEALKSTWFYAALKDWKMWLGMVMYMGCDMPLYGFSLFLPSIVASLGWNTTIVRAQLMSVPPYACAAVLTVAIGYIADRTRARGLCNILVSPLAIVGFTMLIATDRPAVQYAGTFFGALGIYPCISNTITWVANNIEGVYKRGIVLGFVIGWGNLNGVVSSNIYITGPRYFSGHGVILGYLTFFLFGGSVLNTYLLRRENAKRKRGERDVWVEGKTPAEIALLGDERPDFIYTT